MVLLIIVVLVLVNCTCRESKAFYCYFTLLFEINKIMKITLASCLFVKIDRDQILSHS